MSKPSKDKPIATSERDDWQLLSGCSCTPLAPDEDHYERRLELAAEHYAGELAKARGES
jgi:hypothetical protein